MEAALAVSLAAAIVMAASVAYVGQLEFLSRSPRSWWLSLSSGATVGYCFLGLLPKLHVGQKKLADELEKAVPPFEHHLFLVALLGMVTYYGLVLASYKAAAHNREQTSGETTAPRKLLAANVALFSLYAFLLGESVHHVADDGIGAVLTVGGVLAVHFVATDFGLRENFRDRWVGNVRWVIAASVIAGWLTGQLFDPPKAAVAAASAFMVGAILVNVLSDELPERRSARLLPFLVGAVGAGLLFASVG